MKVMKARTEGCFFLTYITSITYITFITCSSHPLVDQRRIHTAEGEVVFHDMFDL
jgi:hypothetical protein